MIGYAFSCKRRGACPSCDAKRATVTAAHALDSLLPDVGYRQWVFVLPKRLRYFIHRSPALAGEASRLLAREIELYYRRKLGSASAAQIHFIQRFGSTINLRLHVHAVVSDGIFKRLFGPLGGERLVFAAAAPPTDEELAAIIEALRRKVLRRFVKLGILPRETAEEMLSWRHPGFSVHAATGIAAGDRAALERLLHYCARPAVSTKRLTYRQADALAVYEAKDNRSGRSLRLSMPAVEFIGRLARLVPPPRKNLVRYYGALGPNAPLRPLLMRAARERPGANILAAVGRALAGAGKAASASARAWARCLSRIFEVDPLACASCGERMEPVAAILKDESLARLMPYLGLSADFPMLVPARGPSDADREESQVGPEEGLFASIDSFPSEEHPAMSEQGCED